MEKVKRLEMLLNDWREELTQEDREFLQDLLENPTADTEFASFGMIQRRLRGKAPSNCGMTWEDVEETDEILRDLGMI